MLVDDMLTKGGADIVLVFSLVVEKFLQQKIEEGNDKVSLYKNIVKDIGGLKLHYYLKFDSVIMLAYPDKRAVIRSFSLEYTIPGGGRRLA